MRAAAMAKLLWLIWVTVVADEQHPENETGGDELCDPSVFPSCKPGLPVGRQSPNIEWFPNGTKFSVSASRASRFFRTNRALPKKPNVHGFVWPEELQGDDHATIAIHAGHDAHIVVAKGSRIQCILELERLFESRYFFPRINYFHHKWQEAAEVVRDGCECDDGPCPSEFENGIIVNFGMYEALQFTMLPQIIERVFKIKRWRGVNHHEVHALMAFYTSPYRSALVLSYDGGGNDGTFNVFLGQGQELYRLARRSINLGSAYNRIASFLPEVNGVPAVLDKVCNQVVGETNEWMSIKVRFAVEKSESFAGKLMGYSGVRVPNGEASLWLKRFYESLEGTGGKMVPTKVLSMICESKEAQQEVAASTQDEFAKFVQPLVANYLLRLKRKNYNVEGIVLTGGCALNVLTNQVIRETLTSFTSGVPDLGKPQDVFVPPAPNDAGLAVGAVWSIYPPTRQQPLQYLGFRLWDMDTLDQEARTRGAQRLSALGGVEYLAELLAGGPAWQRDPNRKADKPIIAVVRGRQEFGPRALGHRSLLAVPDSVEMRERMNRVKFRQWYRPVAPMIADEALEEVFGHKFRSTYMEFAPLVREEVRQRFPALAHFDGTARHQSVGKADEPWLHALLLAVGKRTGLAALINTSFNTRGKPITNTVKACMEMLDSLEDLDFVLIEDWLFRGPKVRKIIEYETEKVSVDYSA